MNSRTQSKTIRVAVIGSINRDLIVLPDGTRQSGWGGILFNLAAMRQHGSRMLTIQPIAYLGSDARLPVQRWLASLPHVNRTGLTPLAQRGNLCRMEYRDDDARVEHLLHPVPSLKYANIRPALDSDLILVNFILGRDVTIGALERLRREFAQDIYIDIHSYLLGRRGDGQRFPRRPQNWRRVIACADFLQMNAAEFAVVSGEPLGTRAVARWVRGVLGPLRCRALFVTRGAQGSICAVRRGRTWQVTAIPATRRPRSIDPTGAGDTFTGAWIAHWLQRGRTILGAARFATRAASRPARPAI